MKNIIEQIKKIDGVKTIEQAGKDMAVVVFEPEKKKQAVRCTTQYEWDFVNQVVHGGKIKTKFGNRCLLGDVFYDTIALYELSVQNHKNWPDEDQVISFSEFLGQRGLVLEFFGFVWDEAAALFKKIEPSAHLNPDDLIEGEIYFAEETDVSHESIFRYKRTNLNIFDLNLSSSSLFVHHQPIRHATPEEKQKLIKAEIEHGYFYELRTS